MSKTLKKIKETKEYIYKKISSSPDFAIVLGSGYSNFSKEVEDPIFIDYEDIPNFPKTTIKGHQGKLIFGKINGKKVIILSGRFHYYEGHKIKKVIFPIRVFHALGVKNLILTNASGGVRKGLKVGDIMIINDHINFMPAHPLHGPNMEELGPRFVSMNEPYDMDMIELAEKIMKEKGISYHKGIYFGLQGPSFETPAEYNMVGILGAAIVGMSTVSETITAKHMGMKVFALSVVTDIGGDAYAEFYDKGQKENVVSHEEVLEAAKEAMPKVTTLLKEFIKSY